MPLRDAFRLSPLLAILLLACEAPEPPVEARPVSTFIPAPGAGPALPGLPAVAALIERLGFSVRAGPHGLVIVAIDLDGPAAQAGTRVGDVVLGVNGAAPADAAELQRLVAAARLGVELQLHRRGAAHQVAIRLVPEDAEGAAAWTPFGLQVRDLTDAARSALGVTHGVMVTKVRAPANRTRILPGDVIIAVDRQEVRDAAGFARLAERAAARGSGAVGLLVKRADADLFVPLESGEANYPRRAPRDTPLRT